MPAIATAAPTVDVQKVATSWLQWNNDLRSSLQLDPYVLDARLSATAQEWSDKAIGAPSFDHKRSEKDSYYNYEGIENRFAQRGVKFKNINRATFSESLGYGYFSCKKDDCTEDLIKAVKTSWTFFMSEQAAFGIHYKALVHPYFQLMGLGVSIDWQAKKYYLTLHYASDIVSPLAAPRKKLPE